MNLEFINTLMEKTDFPLPARAEIRRCAGMLQERALNGEFRELLASYGENGFSAKKTQAAVDKLAGKAGFSAYTLWLVVLISWAEQVKPEYERKGIGGELFWDTFRDLKYKVLECYEIHGIWGNFVAFWYDIFFTCDIVKLGRLEFESCRYPLDEPYICGNIVVKKGDPVKSVHIPSSGEPFDRETRLDAYRRAYRFFGEKPLVCICDSWLLYPAYRELLPEDSNIRSFMDDFDLVHSRDETEFSDAWRLYGREYSRPASELPERTAMQRSFKKHLMAGGKTGEGFGVMVFNGEKILHP